MGAPGSVFTTLVWGPVFSGAGVCAGPASAFRAAFVGFGVMVCFRPNPFCSADGALGLALPDAQGPPLPPGTHPGTVGPRGAAATAGGVALAGAGALVSFPFVRVLVAFGGSGEAVRGLGAGVRG